MPFVQGTSLDATAVVERGWSTVTYLKGLNRTRMQSATAKNYLFASSMGRVFPNGIPCLVLKNASWLVSAKNATYCTGVVQRQRAGAGQGERY